MEGKYRSSAAAFQARRSLLLIGNEGINASYEIGSESPFFGIVTIEESLLDREHKKALG
jgi:hypothetical protein